MEYSVRESVRATRVRIKVSARAGVEIVVPVGFDRSEIPALVAEHATWLERATTQLDEQRRTLQRTSARPDRLDLQGVGETWHLDWRTTAAATVRCTADHRGILRLSGAVNDAGVWPRALRRWVARHAEAALGALLDEKGREVGASYERMTIRCQHTRWGSYSTRGTISLNAQLLFLPPRLVNYVVVHELCHVEHPSHGAEFWSLVSRHVPDHRVLRQELRGAWRHIPAWMQI